MRTFTRVLDTVTYSKYSLPSGCYPPPTNYTRTVVSSTSGRDDAKPGPKPYPTNYWAYRGKFSHKPALYMYYGRRWRSACSFHNYTDVSYDMQPINEASMHVGLELRGLYQGTYYTYEPGVSNEIIAVAHNKARGRLDAQNVNLGTSLGESKQTLQFVVSTLARALSAILSLRNGNYSLAAKHLGLNSRKGLADNYLAYQFGFKPLANDIINGIRDVREVMSRPDFIKIRAVHKETVDFPTNVFGPWKGVGTTVHGCEVGYDLSVTNKFLAGLQALGLLNPLAIAWELVPFSFIVDWFLGIGNWLSSLTANVGLKVHSGYQTTFSKSFGFLIDEGSSKTAHAQVVSGKIDVDCKAHNRLALSNIVPPPILYMKLGLNLNQLVSLMALVQQRS